MGRGEWSKRDVQQARPKLADIERMQASMALAYNWLLPVAEQEEPRIVDDLRKRVQDGRLEEELYNLTVGRSSADLAGNMVLNSMPTVARLLQELASHPPPPTQKEAEAHNNRLKAECDALLLQCSQVQRDFETYVLDSCAVAQRDQIVHEGRMKENRDRCERFVTKFLADKVKVVGLASPQDALEVVHGFLRKIKDECKSVLPIGEDIPILIYTELGQIPAEATGHHEYSRGAPSDWKEVLDVLRELCVEAPKTTAACIVYAKQGSGHLQIYKSSRMLWNADVLKPLAGSKICLDHEVTFRFVQGRHGNDRRAPRFGCLAVHISARRERDNIFTWHLPDFCCGELDWQFPRTEEKDQARAQNLATIREHDRADPTNMALRERNEILGRGFYEKLFGKLSGVAVRTAEFGRIPRKHRCRTAVMEADDADRDDDDVVKRDPEEGDDCGEPSAKRIKTDTGTKSEKREPGLVPNAGSFHVLQMLQAPGQLAVANEAANKVIKAPWLVVAIGAGNGNSALGFLDACASNGGRLVVLELGATHAEFTQRRIAEQVSALWFANKIPVEDPNDRVLPSIERITQEKLAPFDAKPLALSRPDGRLVVPDNLFKKYTANEFTKPKVEEFTAAHYDKFTEGNICVARIRACLDGEAGQQGTKERPQGTAQL